MDFYPWDHFLSFKNLLGRAHAAAFGCGSDGRSLETLPEAFAEAGATNLTVHVKKTCPNLHRTLQTICESGCKAGVASTLPLPYLSGRNLSWHMVDRACAYQGFQVSCFYPKYYKKFPAFDIWIRSIRMSGLRPDGGINTQTLPLVVESGRQVKI